MDKKLKEIQTILNQCRRKSDRLPIPLTIHYSTGSSARWIGPITIENISGGGLKFKFKKQLKLHADYTVKINLPSVSEPIVAQAHVIWNKPCADARSPEASLYEIGVEFTRMKNKDRKTFVSYLCEEILFNYLSQDNPKKGFIRQESLN